MDWPSIRKQFLDEWKNRGVTQVEIATRGKVNQSRISTLKTNPKYIPTVDVFSRVIEGLGLTLSTFFALIENQTNTDLPPSGDSVTTGSRRSSTNAEGHVGGSSQIPGAPDIDLTSVVSTLGVTAIEVVERAIDRGFDRLAAQQTRSAPRRQSRRRAVRRKAS